MLMTGIYMLSLILLMSFLFLAWHLVRSPTRDIAGRGASYAILSVLIAVLVANTVTMSLHDMKVRQPVVRVGWG